MSHDKFNLSSKKKKNSSNLLFCAKFDMKAFLCWSSQILSWCGPGQTVLGPRLRIFIAGDTTCIRVQEEQNPRHRHWFSNPSIRFLLLQEECFSFCSPFLILSSHLVEFGGIFARDNELRCTMCEYTGDLLVFLHALQRKFLALCLWHGRQEIPHRPAQCNKQTSCI